jgi:hypothetical protein
MATTMVGGGIPGLGGQLLSGLSSSGLGIFQPMGRDIATCVPATTTIIRDTIITAGGGRRGFSGGRSLSSIISEPLAKARGSLAPI